MWTAIRYFGDNRLRRQNYEFNTEEVEESKHCRDASQKGIGGFTEKKHEKNSFLKKINISASGIFSYTRKVTMCFPYNISFNDFLYVKLDF